jgi:hypothetical protein
MLKLALSVPSVVKKCRLLRINTWSFIKQELTQMCSKEHFPQFEVNVFLYTAPLEQSHYLVEEWSQVR